MKTLTEWLLDCEKEQSRVCREACGRLSETQWALKKIEAGGEDAAPEYARRMYWDWRACQPRELCPKPAAEQDERKKE